MMRRLRHIRRRAERSRRRTVAPFDRSDRMMSTTDTMLTGYSQASAPLGMTRGMTHAPPAQGFDLAAALFGAPERPDGECAA
jgi:hypothetical protein